MKYKIKFLHVVIVALLIQSCGGGDEKATQELVNVKTSKVLPKQGNQMLSFSGQIVSEDKTVLSFLVGGMVDKLYVNEGDRVKKGDLLATLQPTDYYNDLALREATLLEAEDSYNRMKVLYGKNSVPERDFIRAKAGFLSASAAKDISAKKLSDTKLYAPFDGTIFNKSVRKGTVISPGHPIYQIASIENLEVIFSVPESEVNSITIGDDVETKIKAIDGFKVNAEITSIVSVADAMTRSYLVKARFNNSDGKIKDGMLTEVFVKTDSQTKSLLVPGNAVVMGSNDVPNVYKYDPKTKRALKTRVSLGAVQGNYIVVEQGLSENETIITAGQHQVRDGGEVNVVEESSLTAQNL